MDIPSGRRPTESDSGSYTDLNRMAALKTGDRDSDANLHKVAQEFESLFIGEMLKSMRSANETLGKDDPMNTAATKQYQDMYDQQMSLNLSHKGGIGLQDVLMRQLSKTVGHAAAPGTANHALPNSGENTDSAAHTIGSNGHLGNGLNPFNRALPQQNLLGAAHKNLGNKSLMFGVAAADPARNDMSKLNARRLSLPSKLADRVMAGIRPGEDGTLASATPGSTLVGGLEKRIRIPAGMSVAAASTITKSTSTGTDSSTPAAHSAASASGASRLTTDWTSLYTVPAKDSKGSAALAYGGGMQISGRGLAQPPLAPGKQAFASADEFVATMLPLAQDAAARIGVDPHVLVAQAALETGWGRSIMRTADGTSSHNLFNIKASGNWTGPQARAITSEYKDGQMVKESADFRAYGSYQDSFHDLVSLLQTNDRYQGVVKSADDPEQFVKELQKAGYATDPHYASKISQIAKQMKSIESYATGDSSSSTL